MIRLNLKKDPYWIELSEGLRLYVRPLSTAIMMAARSCAIKDMAELKRQPKEDSLVTDDSSAESPEMIGASESLLIKALGRAAIIKWEGVSKSETDEIAPVTDSNVNDLMDIWYIAQDFWQQYLQSILMLETEGKSSGRAASGTSAAGQNTVPTAKKKAWRVARVKKVC